MKPSEFKKIIKEAMKEAIQEELKEILLEAVKAPKMVPVGVGGYGTVTESQGTYAQPHIEKPKQLTAEERRNMFSGMLGEMQTGAVANTSYQGTINPTAPVDTINGALPEGQVGLDQIMALMNK
jgi:hypothetical protein